MAAAAPLLPLLAVGLMSSGGGGSSAPSAAPAPTPAPPLPPEPDEIAEPERVISREEARAQALRRQRSRTSKDLIDLESPASANLTQSLLEGL